ncbi:MAG: YlxR family protein [Eubacterium sp.]|nr:YlxR family protein [Candidatus Colimonas fimequi]
MKTKKIPMRRCVGCMESKPKNELIRIAYYENEITVDPSGRAKGRGVYLCKDAGCMQLARKKRALQRNFDAEISEEVLDRVFQELKEHEQKDN